MHATRKKKENENHKKHGKTSDLDWMDVFLSGALKCVGFSIGLPRIHQGNYGKPIVAIFNNLIYIQFNIYIYDIFFLFIQFNIYIYLYLSIFI